jgi:hypothetical protein
MAGSGEAGVTARGPAAERSDAGGMRLTPRDIAGLVWCGEMYGTRADLLGALLSASPEAVRRLHMRWRRAGLAETGSLGAGGVWCWLSRAGLDACGLPYSAYRPPLGRLAHVHAVGRVRLALEGWEVYQAAGATWRPERRLRYRLGSAAGRRGHVPDGEVLWPDTSTDFAGEVWCVEAELTPKTAERTAGIMTELLSRSADYGQDERAAAAGGVRYARVLYVCSPAARGVAERARGLLPGPFAGRVEVRSLPEGAL